MKKKPLNTVIGIVLLCGGLWTWRSMNLPHLDSVPLMDLPESEQQKRRADAKQLEDQVRDLGSAAKARKKKPFTIQVTDEQLNTLLQERVDTSQFPVRNLVIGFKPSRVVAQGDVTYNGIEASATVEGSVLVQDGHLFYTADSLQVSGIPAPNEWKSKVDDRVTTQLNKALSQVPGHVESVQVQDGKMIVKGQTN